MGFLVVTDGISGAAMMQCSSGVNKTLQGSVSVRQTLSLRCILPTLHNCAAVTASPVRALF